MAHVFIVYRERKRLMLNSDLFSRNLYMYRTKAGMTQKEVADLMGISQSYISRLEKKIIKRLKKEIVKYE